MLKELTIKNFAIIEDITIFFDDGMTALTGQTGAGKSLIIDSIGLLLGERADGDMIRYGSKKASIKGVFEVTNDNARKILDQYDIMGSEITIYREINDNSKNVIKVNEKSITLNQLKAIGLALADIHVQHDTFRLINPDTYIDLLDHYGDSRLFEAFNDYQYYLSIYKDSLKKYQEILMKNKNLNDKIDLLKFQYEEIGALDLKANELKNLEEEINKMANYDKIYHNLNQAYEFISNVDNIYEAYQALNKIKEYDSFYDEASLKLSGFFYEIEDIRGEINNQISNLDFDPQELDLMNQRYNDISNLLKKYRMTDDELLTYYQKIKEEIMLTENYDEYLNEVKEKLISDYNALIKKGELLTELRKKTALKLSSDLIKECTDLDLENMDFEVSFKETIGRNDFSKDTFNDNGIDKIDFLITLNKGEPKKPLSKVASGGELSRIMLAFKSIFAKIQKLSLIVFDEIDSGISGVAAAKMAQKIYQISKFTQVLCITHLPHVASIADHHIHIYKIESDNRTKTDIKKLSDDDRIKEIAMMISGNKLTPSSLLNAKELLQK